MSNTRSMLPVLCLAIVVGVSAMAAAQDVFQINYFSGAEFADGTLRIDNPGVTYTNVCSMIYVFTIDQQMAECCGCVNSHNNLRTLSVNGDLISNTLTGVIPVMGVVKIVSAAVNGGPCDPTANVTPLPNLRTWMTHVQASVGIPPITETAGSDSTLGATELANLQAQCYFIHVLGSGSGICRCGTGS